ncbi:MAG TPA: TIGR03086 family metal-binding protein [Acidimicrobiales bacterium]|nr:TIGR03086 family metal-binding protein [Acidimicrobiales bacterium]
MAKRPDPVPAWEDELKRLIQLGRDREAAELATHRLAPPSQGAPMDPRDQLDEILPLLDELVASLHPTQLDLPTSCAAFAVRDILEHMIGGARTIAAAFQGAAARPEAEEHDLVATFPVAMAELRAAMSTPGALEHIIAGPFGDAPGDVLARFVAMDGLVHGWDIATATGQPYEPPPPIVAEVDAFSRQAITEDLRDGDTFAAAVEPPADSSAIIRLVAFTGRTV